MRRLAGILAALACAANVYAQKPPAIELGFNPERQYSFGGLDTVNTFSGNVVISLPIGLTYPVSTNLSYGLTLTYNSKIWDYKYVQDAFVPSDQQIWAKPSVRSNAGAGWRVSLGRLIAPVTWSSIGYRDHHDWVYEGPSGDEHAFFSNAFSSLAHDPNATVQFTMDGTALRMVVVDSSTRRVESPDGTIQTFKLEQGEWRLKTIADRYASSVAITYTYNGSSTTQWTISDSHGRVHKIVFQYFNSMADTFDRGMNVDYIETSGTGGATVTYDFQYDNTTAVWNGCHHTYQAIGNTSVFPKLSALLLPDGTHYAFSYYTGGPINQCEQGLLSALTLPTLGKLEYTYQRYTYPPAEDMCISTGPTSDSPGVRTRTVGGATWTYFHVVSEEADVVDPVPNDPAPCPAPPDSPPEQPRAPQRWARTSILTPPDAQQSRTRTDHYFNIYTGVEFYQDDQRLDGDEVAQDAGYGAPIVAGRPSSVQAALAAPDTSQLDESAEDPLEQSLYLSEQTWSNCNAAGDCADTGLLRSVYRQYQWTGAALTGRREAVTTRTVFHDDTGCGGECWLRTARSDPDRVGHMRTTITTSNFPSGGTETRFTNYRAWTDSELNTATTPWALDRFTERSRTLGGETARSLFCVSATGQILRQRTLAGATLSKRDLITQFVYDSSGNITDEKSYGGDTQEVNDTVADLCQVPLGTPRYWNVYGFAGGLLAASAYKDATTSQLLPFKTIDYTVDAPTGLVTASRATDTLETSYSYKDWGTLESVTPPGETSTTYTYTAATAAPAALARVVATRDPSAQSSTDDVTVTYEYDSVGRLSRTERTLPGAGCSEQVITYDQLGRKDSESVWKPCDVTAGTTQYRYDALGRVVSVTFPDGTSTTTSYTGVREVTRTRVISGNTIATREQYDAFGRLIAVTENASVNPEAPAGEVTTSYSYDVGDRLTEVSMPSAGGVQTRTFDYDNRGFLLSEQHPELGADGNGSTVYVPANPAQGTARGYDARGHTERRITGTYDVTMKYDAAERLTLVRETGTSRDLKVYAYDSYGACTGALCAGKRAATARVHYDSDLTPVTGQVAVTEAYQYDPLTGRAARRDVTIGLTTSRTFATAQTYDVLGNPLTTSYPCPTLGGTCDGAQHQQSVTNAYKYGLLSEVGAWASSITYQANGVIDAVTHGSGSAAVRETWTADPHRIPRPRRIAAKNAAGAELWTTNDYQYDGSGNVSAVGNTSYRYDFLNRLAGWQTGTEATGFSAVTQIYDAQGNWVGNTLRGCGPASATPRRCFTSGVAAAPITGTTNHYSDRTYDAAGNVVVDRWAPGASAPVAQRQYTWDALGTMTRANDDGADLRYLYTVDDERIAAVNRTSGVTTYTLRNFSNQLLSVWQSTAAGSLTWKEDAIFRGPQILARETPAGTTHYILDHLGSPRALFNSAGTLIGTQDFAPFGAGGSSNSGALQFTGHERDAATLTGGTLDLPDYMHARYYSPGAARFLSMDRADSADLREPQSWNRYGYALNNPVNAVDPDGRQTCIMPSATPKPDEDPFWKWLRPLFPTLPTRENPIIIDPARPLQTLPAVLFVASLVSPFVGDERVAATVMAETRPLVDRVVPALSDAVAANFERGRYAGRVLSQDMVVYRAEGQKMGRWFGLQPPDSAASAERLYNILSFNPENTLTLVQSYQIPAGTTIYEGPVAGGFGRQVYVPDPWKSGVYPVGRARPIASYGF